MFEQLAENVRLARIALEKDKDVSQVLERLSRLEAEIQESEKRLQACYESYCTLEKEMEERLNAKIASLKKNNEMLTNAYNEASKVINNLTERLIALEKNYDPTIIE